MGKDRVKGENKGVGQAFKLKAPYYMSWAHHGML